jgi:hypothetical protein
VPVEYDRLLMGTQNTAFSPFCNIGSSLRAQWLLSKQLNLDLLCSPSEHRLLVTLASMLPISLNSLL